MPLYEYRCRECDRRFELRRSFTDADAPVSCPDGHGDAVRLLATFAAVGQASAPGPSGGAAPSGPCGGNCACFHGT